MSLKSTLRQKMIKNYVIQRKKLIFNKFQKTTPLQDKKHCRSRNRNIQLLSYFINSRIIFPLQLDG